jgi:hypothetical protein
MPKKLATLTIITCLVLNAQSMFDTGIIIVSLPQEFNSAMAETKKLAEPVWRQRQLEKQKLGELRQLLKKNARKEKIRKVYDDYKKVEEEGVFVEKLLKANLAVCREFFMNWTQQSEIYKDSSPEFKLNIHYRFYKWHNELVAILYDRDPDAAEVWSEARQRLGMPIYIP